MENQITYHINKIILTEDIISVFESSGISRPTNDFNRISKMFLNANLVISAWDKELLVGLSRALTDFSYCCYLSDLAVRKEYQNVGIGKKLIDLTKDQIGENSMLLLLSAPNATDYYPKIGFEKVLNGFIIKRKK